MADHRPYQPVEMSMSHDELDAIPEEASAPISVRGDAPFVATDRQGLRWIIGHVHGARFKRRLAGDMLIGISIITAREASALDHAIDALGGTRIGDCPANTLLRLKHRLS